MCSHAYFSYISYINLVFSELFLELIFIHSDGCPPPPPSIAQGDRTELEIYIRDRRLVITQLCQD